MSLREAAEAILAHVEGEMSSAHNNARVVCCGRPGPECCGSPEPEWDEADMLRMDVLAPVQKALRDALAEAEKAEPVAWTPVTTRRPPWNERKVVCYTEGHDYGGSRFITMPASDFHCYDEDDPDEPGSRESKTVSHWIYEDDLIAAARGKG